MDKPSDKYWALCIYLALALTTFAAFSQVRNHDFVNYDDTYYVTENRNVKAGLTRDSIIWAFTTGHADNWHPLTWLSHMLDCQLFGTDPGWHHLTNLLLHITNTLLLFAVFKRMTHTLWQSAFVAVAFALHPLHVESVAWVSERKDVLSTLFWILTMAAYLRYVKRPGITRYLLTLLTFALGLMAKPMLVTLPFALLLLDYWPLSRFQLGQTVKSPNRRRRKSVSAPFQWQTLYRLVCEKVPFLVLSAISSIITFIVQRSGGAVKVASLTIRIANAFISYARYMGKMIWPWRMAMFYPHLGENLPMWQAIASALLLLIISLGVIWLMRSRRYLLTGWLWYLGTLVPVIGLVQVGMQAMADRYTYVSLTGLFIIVAWGLPELVARWRYKKIVLGATAAVVVPAMMLCTWRQVSYWRNSYTLFTHALAVTDDNYVAHHALGTLFYKQKNYKMAIFHYKQTMKIKPVKYYAPDYANAPGDIGMALLQLAEYDQAADAFREALKRNSELQKWHLGLGIALQKQGQLDEAITHFNKALQIKPDYLRARKNLADAFFHQSKFKEAARQYQQVLQMHPLDPATRADTHNDLGVVLVRLGRLDKAVTNFTRALHIKPDFANAHNNLAFALSRQGKFDQAISHFTKAIQIKPDWVDPINNLAWLLATHKQAKFRNPKEAVRLAQRACELTKYENPGILDTLAAAYAADDRFPQAIETAEKAIKLADSHGEKKLAQQIRNRLPLYKAGQHYIEH
jgi:tetratricopeptide (TPR) repeat protein